MGSLINWKLLDVHRQHTREKTDEDLRKEVQEEIAELHQDALEDEAKAEELQSTEDWLAEIRKRKTPPTK